MEATVGVPPTGPARAGAAPSTGRAALLLLAAAFAIRCIWFGNPVTHIDEQFYLLVGDRMVHGHALPFVDIWDRKPVGLFLLYAGMRLLGGNGVVGYHVVATLFAWGTALVIAGLARRIASPMAAISAGLAYLLWLPLLSGQGGQTPVFYNLPMALAALLVARAAIVGGAPRRIIAFGAGAMALVGIALQIKYSALFEGLFLGCVLIWAHGRRVGRAGWSGTAGAALLWIALALAPTLAALGWYAAIGHAHDFVFANFLSIGSRGGAPLSALVGRLRFILLILLPLLGTLAGAGGSATPARGWRRFLLLWLAAATAGVALFGTFYEHYALPLLPPLCAAMASAFDRRMGRWIAAAVLLFGLGDDILAYQRQVRREGDAATAARLTALIAPNLRGRCLFVYQGEPVLYLLTHACIPTRYAFPSHLNELLEAQAIGADPVAEVTRVLASRPGVIVDALDRPRRRRHPDVSHPGDDPATNALVAAALARDYRLVGEVGFRRDIRRVWALRAGR